MNTKANKYETLRNQLLIAPRSFKDIDIALMECMEQIEFAGNNSDNRELFGKLFQDAAELWFPNEHYVDVFDRYYYQTKDMVA